MERKKVKSSNIKSLGYNSNEHILEIEFLSGGVYKYLEVGPTVYDEFLKADSKGKYFYKYIKGQFTCEKIGAKEYPTKTLKDFSTDTISIKVLRAEAQKWLDIYSFDNEKVKMKESRDAIKAWIEYFFNL